MSSTSPLRNLREVGCWSHRHARSRVGSTTSSMYITRIRPRMVLVDQNVPYSSEVPVRQPFRRRRGPAAAQIRAVTARVGGCRTSGARSGVLTVTHRGGTSHSTCARTSRCCDQITRVCVHRTPHPTIAVDFSHESCGAAPPHAAGRPITTHWTATSPQAGEARRA